ncbi:penicillin acylase family protein [Catellatospora tritici]|uniref:penicillin acylase family protein n=1 Tax=Catellatospora tritici TaxID=2851566 RepID=UPI001C2DBAB4|nr:penicillin acylase family protein [Catellatospora tritici]MBV1853926.1 penicillin acylase family protein [Catellatospora tritici]
MTAVAPGVYRDAWGIPHLYANSADELSYLQGRTAAYDRAWQLEVERWRGEGVLAARLGEVELGWDRFARRAGLDATGRRCFDRLDADTRRWLGAYVDGVNDGLAAGAARAPEFAAAATGPGRWRPWSPLSVFLVQHILFGTFPDKLWRAHVRRTLGPNGLALFETEGPGGSGSNAWAVTGARSGTGAPMIAGDPHRVLELPGIYQQVHLSCPEFDIVGLAFPGVPGIAHFGHTGQVAWAITNAMADYQDLYREQLRRDGEQILVRDPDGWVPASVRLEPIEVRGGPTRQVEVIETARGPVIDVDARTGEGVSLRTPTLAGGDLGFGALPALLRARTVVDVEQAMAGWVEPVNSVLVADTTGAVRRLAAGRVPVRDEQNRRGPVPGWSRRHGWRDGWAALPSAGLVDVAVHANDRRPGDGADLGSVFAPPHRGRRIRELLAADRPAEAIHADDRLPADALRDLLRAIPPQELAGPARRLRDRLLSWDGRMRADSTDAGAFAAWRAALARRLHDHPALAPLLVPTGFDALFAPWTDPCARIGYALDTIVTRLHHLGGDPAPAAAAALAEVAADAERQWGSTHVLNPIRAAADAGIDAVIAAACGTVALSGDTDCVLSNASVPGVTDACRRGPVARYVWNLADRDASRWVVPFGADGVPGAPHFADQLPRWAVGELVPVVTDFTRLHRQELP